MTPLRSPGLLAPAAGLLLFATRALAQVPAGGEFRVNVYTTDRQSMTSVASHDRHGFVIVWRSDGQDGSGSGVFGRRYDVAGTSIGTEFLVPVQTTFNQFHPQVAFGRAGDFLVVWQESMDSAIMDVFGRRFDRSGAPLGGQFLVNTGTAFRQTNPAIAALNPGFVVVWQTDDPTNPDFPQQLRGQLLDAAGARVGTEFRPDTTGGVHAVVPAVAADPAGNFVVAWQSFGYTREIQARRFDRHAEAQGGEFTVNTYLTGRQRYPSVAFAEDGSFVVAWNSERPPRPAQIAARRFDATGSPLGQEVVVSPARTSSRPAVATDSAGNFTVQWWNSDGSADGIWARRFRAGGTPRGGEFRVNSYTTGYQRVFFSGRHVAADGAGNLVSVWSSDEQDGSDGGAFAQRYGGLVPAGLSVADGGNAVLEVGDTFALATAWRNVNGAALTFQGHRSDISVPAGLSLSLSPDANYGTVPNGAAGACVGPCFAGTLSGTRPAGHVDARFLETIAPDVLGQVQRWTLHVGDSFTDVPRASPFYVFVETLAHHGVTDGCGGNAYCPAASVTREQMSVFVLAAREGPGYVPRACTTPVFGDVPASSPFCRWVEELARRGVTGGCGGGNFCPADAVSREQMPVFVLRTLDPALDPPACTTPMFGDVPASSPFCRWIEELARRGIVNGCGGGNYCPAAPVTREQMAVFLTGTFGLTLYGA